MDSEEVKDKLREKWLFKVKEHLASVGFVGEDVEKLAEKGFSSLSKHIKELRELIKGTSLDRERLVFLTHTMKGVLLNFGLAKEAEAFGEVKGLADRGAEDHFLREKVKELLHVLLG